MYHKRTGSYDEIPEGMKAYINNYGCHFNKKLSDWAASQMYKNVNGKRQYVQLERGKLYDSVYLANMVKADFMGSSIPNEQYLAKYVKDVLDDADAEEGFVFNRFYGDTVFMNNPVDWDEML